MYTNFCSKSNYFCKCYYVDVLLHHCIRYCIQGIHLQTWESINKICLKKDTIFNVHYGYKYDNLNSSIDGIESLSKNNDGMVKKEASKFVREIIN